MGQISTQTEQARENARKSNGEFGSYDSGESGASLPAMMDEGEQAYNDLTDDERAGWEAWREMTGKSEETVMGPAKVNDIADFKNHYLASSDDEFLPDGETARRLGLSADSSEANDQWGEMVSAGTVETHTDEDGTVHSFAHPHLARTLNDNQQSTQSAQPQKHSQVYTTRDEAIQRQIVEPLGDEGNSIDDETLDCIADDVLEYHTEYDDQGNQRLDKSGFVQKVDTDQFWESVQRHVHEDEEVEEPDLDHIYPDFDDFTISSQDAVRMSGLESLQHGEIYWDDSQAFSSGKPDGHSDSVGFEARGEFADIETDYLTDELREAVNKHSGGRELRIANYSDHASHSQVGERAQFVSVSLNDAERTAVIDHLNRDDPEEFNEDLVDFWSDGDPKGADNTFGFVSTHKEWNRVSDAVREVAPDAAHALSTAEDLRRDVNACFESEVEQMNSDEWKKEEAQRRNEF